MDLDNLKRISHFDRENMLDLLVSFPRQCEDALFIGERTKIGPTYNKKYANIIFTGLGGSAIGADIVKGYIGDEVNIPIIVNRNYTMPASLCKDSLVFAVSYSGNTEETLSAYNGALKSGANIIAITSGGRLKELASRNKNTLIIIPKGYPPRCALGYSFIPAIIALSKIRLIKEKEKEIRRLVTSLDNLQKKNLNPSVKGKKNISKYIAKKLHKKFPVIYASDRLGSIVTRWRGQLAENSKTLSSTHVFPEMNHNEIVGWQNPAGLLKNFTAVLLRDREDYPRIKKRMDITKAILKKNGFCVLEIESCGTSFLERMLSLVYIGDFASFYLSILNRIDPTPVDRIAYLKKQLAKG